MPNEFVDKLMDMMKYELENLHRLHPYQQPGLWDVAVDNIRSIRAVLLIHQNQETAKRLSR